MITLENIVSFLKEIEGNYIRNRITDNPRKIILFFITRDLSVLNSSNIVEPVIWYSQADIFNAKKEERFYRSKISKAISDLEERDIVQSRIVTINGVPRKEYRLNYDFRFKK